MVLKGKGPVYTDRKWKNFKYGYEVPKKVMRSDFDHLDEDSAIDGFLLYRGNWYHISDFMRISPGAPDWMKHWSGYTSDSAFSGILIKISDDGEQYIIGTYIT